MTAPTKLSSIHSFAEQSGAEFENRNGWLLPARYTTVEQEIAAARQRVGIADLSAGGKILVEGNAAAALVQTTFGVSGLTVNQGNPFEFGFVFRLRDDHYFVHTPPHVVNDAYEALLRAADTSPERATVTDITHGRAEIGLLGPRSRELLSLLCGLDLHEAAFPNQTAKQTSIAKTTNILIRNDIDGVLAYRLIGARSYGKYLWDIILQAGEQFGIAPVGLVAFDRMFEGA